MMVAQHSAAPEAPADTTARRPRWPLATAVAGLLGLLAGAPYAVTGERMRAEPVLLCATAMAMLLAAALWRCHVEPRTRHSAAAGVVPLGLLASAAALPVLKTDEVGAWTGVLAAALALVWMGLCERTVSRALALASGLCAVLVVAAPAIGGPSWLLLTGLVLALGRSTISR